VSTIGSILIAFSAATGGYFAGSKAVKDDASSVESTFGGIGGSLTEMFAGIGAGLSAGALVEGLKNAGEQVTELARDADKLSVSTEQLSRLRFAAKDAGVDAETLSKAMLKAQESIGKAAVEGGETAATLEKFGIHVDELKNKDAASLFSSVANSIAAIQNPSKRAAAEVAVFARSGAELKPFLEQGAAGIAAMSAEADKLGATVSSVDAESTLRASKAVDKVQEAIQGLGEHIAAGLAPEIEDVANRMVAWAETGQHVQSIVSGALAAVSMGVSFLVDIWTTLKGTVEIAGGIIVGAIGVVLKITDLWADGAAKVINMFGGHIDVSAFDDATSQILGMSKAMVQEGAHDVGKVFSGENRDKVTNYFQDIQNQAQKTSAEAVKAHQNIAAAFDAPEASENLKKITSTLQEMHKAVDEFGMSEGAKKLHELKTEGASSAQLAEAAALAKQLDTLKSQADVMKELDKLKKDSAQAGLDASGKLVADLRDKGATASEISAAQTYQSHIESVNKAKEAGQKLDEEAKKVREDALTPLQKEQQQIADLQKLYDSGRISKEQFATAAARDKAALAGDEHNTQKVATRGTEAAFSLMNEINKRINGGGKEDIARKQLAVAEKGNSLFEKAIDVFKGATKLSLANLGI
jgi:hypothetical protein